MYVKSAVRKTGSPTYLYIHCSRVTLHSIKMFLLLWTYMYAKRLLIHFQTHSVCSFLGFPQLDEGVRNFLAFRLLKRIPRAEITSQRLIWSDYHANFKISTTVNCIECAVQNERNIHTR